MSLELTEQLLWAQPCFCSFFFLLAALTPGPCVQSDETQQASVQSKVFHTQLVKHMLQPCTVLLFEGKGFCPSKNLF
jgi:hypothetical protein